MSLAIIAMFLHVLHTHRMALTWDAAAGVEPQHSTRFSFTSLACMYVAGTGQVSHNQLLNSHGSNFGLAKAPYLYPMQQQALSLAEIEAQLGMNTLPPAAALEGGVLESEMANDENAPWRMPRS